MVCVMRGKLGRWLLAWLLCLLLGACATPQRLAPQDTGLQPKEPQWEGRLSLVIDSTPETSLSAAFLLRGSAKQGGLDFYSPLGTTLAALRWSSQSAIWLQGDGQRTFDSLDHLTEKATGTVLPISHLFDWLEGKATSLPGWQADSSQLAQGLLVVRRSVPTPSVVLRIKLD